LSIYIRKFRSYLRKNETARGLFLVGIVILGAIAVWGGIRLALNTEYPILVVSSGSMCQRLNPVLHNSACTLEIGALIVIRGQDPAVITNGTIIIFRPYTSTPDYLVVHRVIKVYQPGQSTYNQYTFWTEGDANGVQDGWDQTNGGIPGSQVVGVYQTTIPIPYLGAAILDIRGFMYDDATGQPKTQGILVIVALIVALFAFEVAEPGKKKPPTNVRGEAKTSTPPTTAPPSSESKLDSTIKSLFFSLRPA
jgi:signal peptidase I